MEEPDALVEEADDLQRFIADCEWKTRKILRESNKRMKDNARSLAAKERLEKLKHGGTPTKPGGLSAKAGTPLESKSLNVFAPSSPSEPAIKKLSPTPAKEWKGRDRIIHDAYETIKSLPVEKKSLKATATATHGSQPSENARVGIHSSLSASPFCGAKTNPDSVAKPKQKAKVATPQKLAGKGATPKKVVSGADASAEEGAEPAMITRRTIERDFYIMSKKRSNPASKRRQQQSEPTPELKTSVLRKKYRCDERIMKAKKNRAERAYERLKRLKLPTDDSAVVGDETDDSDSSVSLSEEEECTHHAIHDLVEQHIEYENARSLKRSNKLLAKRTFKPNVKEFWAHLQQGNNGVAIDAAPSDTEAEDLDSLDEIEDVVDWAGAGALIVEEGPVSRYSSPYVKPAYVKLQLVLNEPLAAPNDVVPWTISISLLRKGDTENDSFAAAAWVYELYDPCNGSTETFALSDQDVASLIKALPPLSTDEQHNMQTLRNGAAAGDLDVLAVTTKARESLCALRNTTGTSADGIERLVGLLQTHSSITHELSTVGVDPPLSMRITGCSPYTNTVCPGQAPIGKRGVWRLVEPAAEEVNRDRFPVWPALKDIKYPESLDKSQAAGYFQYRNLGPKKGDCVTVLSCLAFESPVLAPYVLATDKGYVSPPFAEHEPVTGVIPYVYLPGTNLMENPVESRLDALLPPPIVVLDPGASEGDWNEAPTNADGQVYHLRELDERDGDGFRVKTSANVVEYDDSISSMVYGISESAASPNRPIPSPFLTHTSREACTQSLIRVRTSADYHYIAESDGEGTLSEPYLFSTHMSAYKSVFVSRKSISSYREQERFLHATKEAERKKLDLALKMKAAEELVEARLKERIARIEQSVHEASDLEGTSAQSVAVDLPSADVPDAPAHADKIPCDVELLPPSTQSLEEEDSEEGNELEQLAKLLLKDTNFLKAVARKLNISEDRAAQVDASDEAATVAEDKCDDGEPSNTLRQQSERVALHQTSAVAPSRPSLQPMDMPKLKLNCKRYRDMDLVCSRGDGWKRLPRSETIIGNFSLTKRNVQRGVGGPKFRKLGGGRNFIAVDAVEELQHQSDSQQFVVEPRSLFIPDLTTERLRLARTYRQQKKAKESMLSLSQQQSLDEILKIPVSEPAKKAAEDLEQEGSNLDAGVDGECGDESSEEKVRPRDVSRAILAVKNHNLSDLEDILDARGLSVETRDQHGNTLFILACQQGSKKLAKFLLRRGAHINAQNNGGNTALHYLYEYKHVSLAEYLGRKGADDSIKNADGNTVYEGTQLNSMFGR